MIALITDFGLSDNYVGVVKGVIKKISPFVEIIDITHSVKLFSIINAQYHLYTSYKYFPEGTIFYTIVDPGVGSSRKGLIAADGNYKFIAPDNGILSAVKSNGMKIYEIDESLYKNISSTFHGRDVFAPAAAKLAIGTEIIKLGKITDNIVEKKFPVYSVKENYYLCNIIHIDRFGNVILSIPNKILETVMTKNCKIIHKEKNFLVVKANTYSEIQKNKNAFLQGSSGFIELCKNQSSIAEEYRLEIGEELKLSYDN